MRPAVDTSDNGRTPGARHGGRAPNTRAVDDAHGGRHAVRHPTTGGLPLPRSALALANATTDVLPRVPVPPGPSTVPQPRVQETRSEVPPAAVLPPQPRVTERRAAIDGQDTRVRQPEGYSGFDRPIADLTLLGIYCDSMYQALVRDGDRIAHVVGAILLAELYLHGQIRIDAGGKIHPQRRAHNDDVSVNEVLADLQAQPHARPAGPWIRYFAHDHRATRLVWRRLVEADVAQEEKSRLRWKKPRHVLTSYLPVGWTRKYLEHQVTDQAAVPPAAAILWRGLQALCLDSRTLDLDPRIASRLEATPLPAELDPLFAALDDLLIHLAIPL
ncbi:GPP34 family phosphoprotein [Amycolatopsis sp. NEAU-NG30]|uniref:GPP34 family phosphoprotein n=1 Tax=Amycolatopsis melonis TaxID=3156488 RepID=A0ABV0LEK3_9PSEU